MVFDDGTDIYADEGFDHVCIAGLSSGIIRLELIDVDARASISQRTRFRLAMIPF